MQDEELSSTMREQHQPMSSEFRDTEDDKTIPPLDWDFASAANIGSGAAASAQSDRLDIADQHSEWISLQQATPLEENEASLEMNDPTPGGNQFAKDAYLSSGGAGEAAYTGRNPLVSAIQSSSLTPRPGSIIDQNRTWDPRCDQSSELSLGQGHILPLEMLIRKKTSKEYRQAELTFAQLHGIVVRLEPKEEVLQEFHGKVCGWRTR